MSEELNADTVEHDAKDNPASSLSLLGERLREERKQVRLSLAELSEKAGVSVAMLSHIETGKTSPSLRSLDRIRTALNVPMSRLFPHPEAHDAVGGHVVVRHEDRRKLEFPEIGLTKVRLSPTDQFDLEVLLLHIEPGGGSGAEPWARIGEKAGIVLSGELRLEIGDDVYELKQGDSFQFDSSRPHRFENPGDGEAEVVWIIRSSPLIRTVAV